MQKPLHALALALVLAAAAIVTGLAIRPLMPPDETRYVQVGRDMQASGDFVVPHHEGKPYAHKPPILFWLMNAAWAVFGNAAWVARAVSPAAGLLCIALTYCLARGLWPERPDVAGTSALILASGVAWCGYSSLVMFDAPLTACVLGVLGGAVLAARRGGVAPWLLVGACIGLGILVKGPITFLHALPALIAAPWWARLGEGERRPWSRYYPGLMLAIAIGAALALCWAIPAAHRGGPEFGGDILWNQTAHRMVRAFAHRRPLYWYLIVLPVGLVPWSLWLSSWRALGRLRRDMDAGVRFCLAWAVPTLVFLSLVSGKQAHYLLPMLPAISLLLARGIGPSPQARVRDLWPVSAGLVVIGGTLLALSILARDFAGELPKGVSNVFVHVRPIEPALLVLVGVLVVAVVPRIPRHVVPALAATGVVTVVLLQASITGWGSAADKPWPPWESGTASTRLAMIHEGADAAEP